MQNEAIAERQEIRVGGLPIGGEQVVVMAGPCAIESFDQLVSLGKQLREMGVSILRGSAYKPRTSPYSFQGFGKEALKWHSEAKKEHGLLIETEVLDTRDVELVAEHVDLLRIGMRNMQNFALLKEVAGCKKPVILKRHISATLEEWLLSAEYLMAYGNSQVILCERGIRTFETTTRSTLDLGTMVAARLGSQLPLIVDPSHAAGKRELVAPLSKAAIAAGADGLLIEVHECPSEAVCDGRQALLPSDMEVLIPQLASVATAVGRWL